MTIAKNKTEKLTHKLWNSVWLFPIVLMLLVIVLTFLQVSGSSMGTYHKLFYGDREDPSLIIGDPQGIRSDEWLVNTQITIAQSNNNFERINDNIGNGQDVSLMLDVPYKEWSTVFKPHNLPFLILPFDNAFALKWWLMAYLLILGCYFFILALLPNRRLLASLLSLGFFFSPFIQWWYLYGTLGAIYYSLFGGAVLIHLLREQHAKRQILWGLLLAYLAACFLIMLYPPFQIACALVIIAFAAGYLIEQLSGMARRTALRILGVVVLSMFIAGATGLAYLATRSEAVRTVTNTAYPGDRTQKSGGYDLAHLFSGHLDAQLQSASRAGHYSLPDEGLTNQSENSSFIFLIPFLLFPSFYLLYRHYKKTRVVDWPLLAVNGIYLFLILWLFVPHLGILGKLTLLQSVPHTRLLIGMGVLSLIQLVLFIRRYENYKKIISRRWAIPYGIAVWLITFGVGLYVMDRLPGFVGIYRVIVFSLPLPLIIYLLLRKRYVIAATILLLFSFAMTYRVNPLYRGTETLTATPVSQAIKEISRTSESRWATEHFLLENFVFMNGARSLTGVYSYPQLDLWREADAKAEEKTYNRYAHTNFTFDRDPSKIVPTKIALTGGDSFTIITEPCSDFLKKQDVRYLLTGSEVDLSNGCVEKLRTIRYPAQTIYIYGLKF